MSTYVRAYEGEDPYIFISYAHKDKDRVLPVIRQLYELKYRVWYDEGINPGGEWPRIIEQHLLKASQVLVFVSKDSLCSPNCQKEISRAPEAAEMVMVLVDDAIKSSLPEEYHLSEKLSVRLSGQAGIDLDEHLMEALINRFDDSLIGDGITGYEYLIDHQKTHNRWNLLLGFAVILVAVFSVLLYGLHTGYFDSYLPAKQSLLDTAAPAAEPPETISIQNTVLGSVLPVAFSSEAEKTAVYEKLGWGEIYEMTYKDLLEMDGITHLEIRDEPIDTIRFAVYLPNLESITLSNSWITDLSPLAECPNLHTVFLTADMLPVTLPESPNFEVEII